MRTGPRLLVLALALTAGCQREREPTRGAERPAVTLDAGASPAAVAAREAPVLCAHGVPADLCTRCNPDLMATFKELGDWCDEHGVPESQCLQCNPGLTFTAARTLPDDWCAEHSVPESKCTQCNPKLVAKFIEAGDYCREHGFPESVCPYCHPERVEAAGAPPPQFPAPGTRIRLASASTAREAGLAVVPARRQPIRQTLEVVGQLSFDRNRLAELSARTDSVILEARVDVGDDVKAGQPVVVLASGELGGVQARLRAARARLELAERTLERERGLAEKGISPRQAVDDAERERADARAELETAQSGLGAAGAAVSGGDGGRYTLTAPFAGTVVARDAVAGRSVGRDQVLVTIADLARLWAELELPEADAARVRPGQEVTVVLEGAGRQELRAQISRVGNAVDPATRTVKARVELPNPERRLKAGTFVRARISVSGEHAALIVPREALQTAQGRTLVFVKQEEGLYVPVAVRAGAAADGWVEIEGAVAPGAEVVTRGAFLLKTELLKDSIGAGCCEVGE